MQGETITYDARHGICPDLMLDVYELIKDKFCETENIEKDRWTTEHDFWNDNWEQFQESIDKKKLGKIPEDYRYLYKFYNKAIKYDSKIKFALKNFDIFARYCGYNNITELFNNKEISAEAKEAQFQFLEILDITELASNPYASLALDHYINTNWWLYFHGYNNRKNKLIRLKFRIGENYSHYYHTRLVNTSWANHPDYIGFIDARYSTQQFFVCNMRTLANNRYLHLKINMESEANGDICLGHYSNYDHNNLICGTMVLQRSYQSFDEMEPKEFEGQELDSDELPLAVKEYLYDKSGNFFKTPRSIFSLEKLSTWGREYDNRSERSFSNSIRSKSERVID